jgi:hypothetical protein
MPKNHIALISGQYTVACGSLVACLSFYNISTNFETMFRLDRTIGKGHSHEAGGNQAAYWRSKSVDERLAGVMYLNSIVYGFDINNPPRLDKTVFSTRKHKLK